MSTTMMASPSMPIVASTCTPDDSQTPSLSGPLHRSLTQAQVHTIRKDFPALHQQVRGKHPLVYLDNAATTHKPQSVIDAMVRFMGHDYGTVRRGVYDLSARATQAFEASRTAVAHFLGASVPEEIVFTKGTTEAINLVVHSYGYAHFKQGDEVILSAIEHHANIVPWQLMAQRLGIVLKVIPVSDTGELDLEAYRTLFTSRTKFVSVVHVSNALGTVNPVAEMIALAHSHGVPVLVDGAQSAPHMPVDVQALDADFYVFSGHKVYGPSGVGVLYGKMKHLETMVPYQGGGDMIDVVSFEETTYAPPPRRFEAGTPPMAEVIGLHSALTYVNALGMDVIDTYERELLTYATERMRAVQGLRFIGEAQNKAGIVSFTLQGIHPHDIGTMLDQEGIAIRAGHHCAQPVMTRFCVPATARASFAFYNTFDEIDALCTSLNRIVHFFS
ncbi:MAG: SufS family cysteine desulfurase [Vampirovibrionales bacterium]